MERYLIPVGTDFRIVTVQGFVPENAVMKIPDDLPTDDIEVCNLDVVNKTIVLNDSKLLDKAQRAKDALAKEAVQRQALKDSADVLQSLVGKSLSPADQKRALEALLAIIFNQGSTLAIELLKLRSSN
jgi:hypothetical protein